MDTLTKIFDGDPLAALLVILLFVCSLVIGFGVACMVVCAPPLPWRVRKSRASDDGIHGDVVIVPRDRRAS